MDKPRGLLSKTLVIGIIILLLGVSVTPTIGISNNDDTTPPITTHTLDPSEPDGLNGWYVSDVNVTLTATDDISGVNITYYCINGGEWEVYTELFTLSENGDNILIEYYSVDYADNVEDVKSTMVDIDQTEPDIALSYEVLGFNWGVGWEFQFTATATDAMSGMERVEFYVNNKSINTVYGAGPEYVWTLYIPFPSNILKVRGLIHNLELTDEYVKFNALIVRISRTYANQNSDFGVYAYDNAGNREWDEILHPCKSVTISPGIYLFQNLTLPNNYYGHIGRFFISATFGVS